MLIRSWFTSISRKVLPAGSFLLAIRSIACLAGSLRSFGSFLHRIYILFYQHGLILATLFFVSCFLFSLRSNHGPTIRYAHLGDCVSRKSPSNWVGLELHICNEVLLLLTAFSARMISITRERTSCVRTVVDTRTTTFLVGASTAVPHLG